MSLASNLPPGQEYRSDFPRFGLPQYADRRPTCTDRRLLSIRINGGKAVVLDDAFAGLTTVERTSDFHCVTTWSYPSLTWRGVLFRDFVDKIVTPLAAGQPLHYVVYRAQDGYKTSLPMADALDQSVLIADQLNQSPLCVAHGAPLRFVAPRHYGYKNLKHLAALEFYTERPSIKRGFKAFLDHPRARVALEERGRWFPGWLLRRIYRPQIARTIKQFQLDRSASD